MNPLLQLLAHGQSYWLDNLTRQMLRNGELARRIHDEGLRGQTSNPAIFGKAIGKSQDYDEQIERLIDERRPTPEIYEALAIQDIQAACDLYRPVYDESKGLDGYVSLEVSPHLAHDMQGSLEEARRLHRMVQRPNVMIKIPGTPEAVPAIEEALFEGIPINVTLLFSIESYEAVAWAYIRALERRLEQGKSINALSSVASFFLSRIDVEVDKRLKALGPVDGIQPQDLLGKMAVANAKLAYQRFREILDDPRWQVLERQGAKVQRMLWASTSTKNPDYRDVMYVEPLIGPDTVNTMPDETIAAFADHGVVRDTVMEGMEEARQTMQALEKLGISFREVTELLMTEGMQKFVEPFDQILDIIEKKRSLLGGEGQTRAGEAASKGAQPAK